MGRGGGVGGEGREEEGRNSIFIITYYSRPVKSHYLVV